MDPSVNRQHHANLERLELAAEAAGIGFWDWDLVADRLCPDRFLSARFGIGLRSGCLPAEEFEQLLYPDDLTPFVAAIGRALKSTERVEHRCRMQQLDGSIRHIHVYLQVARDKLGKPMRMLGMLKDVTSEVESAQRLADTMSHGHQLLERLSVAIQAAGLTCWEFCYLEERFIWVDSLPDDVDPRTIAIDEVNRVREGTILPEDAELVRLETVRALAAGAQSLSSRLRRRMPDGSIRHFQVYQRFFRDDHGRPLRALGATRDITEEVFAAERLRVQKDELLLAQRRLERASISVQEGHWEIDLVTRRHWASSTYYVLLGYPPDSKHLEKMEAVQGSGASRRSEARAARPRGIICTAASRMTSSCASAAADGEYRRFRLRGNAERDESGVALRVSGHDSRDRAPEGRRRCASPGAGALRARIEGTQDGLWEVDMRARQDVVLAAPPRAAGIRARRVVGSARRAARARPDDLATSDKAVTRQAELCIPIFLGKCGCARRAASIAGSDCAARLRSPKAGEMHARLGQHAGRDRRTPRAGCAGARPKRRNT